MIKLIMEEPYKDAVEFEYTQANCRRFYLDSADKALMESGGVVFKGEVAFSLEEVEGVGV